MSRRVVFGASSLLAAATIVFGAMRASGAAWLSDDSFISFRYAQQLVHGSGLVYNAGERVEGYTNLLWTLLVAAAMRIGIRPEISAHVLGLGFWFALIGLLALVSYRRTPSQAFAPLAATLVLLMDDYQIWATGGLETSMFAFLSVAGLLLATASHARPGRLLSAGLLLLAAVGTRPDGVIFAAVAVAGVWLVNENASPRARLALTAALAGPLMLGGAVLAAFKLLYYGDLLPTAFYSKSALQPYYSQGLFYVYLFFKKNWFLCPLVIGLITLALAQRVRPSQLLNRRHLVLLTAFVAFVAYVAHSGGDFMFARRLIPAMPLLFIVLEGWLVTIPGWTVKVGVLALLLLGVGLPYPIYPNPTERIRGIANEPAYYTQPYAEMRQAQGAVAARILGGAPVRAMFEGGMCMFGYYSGLPYLVEMTGLTQYSLAKMSLTVRGHVGHEKVADARWMTEHGIHFVFAQEPVLPRSELRVDEIVFDGILKARIWIYADAIMDPLRSNPDVRFLPIEGTLREAQRHIEGASHAEARRIYDVLQRYYFQTAGPEKKPLADALWRQVEARRAS
jgi:hypothetical protein